MKDTQLRAIPAFVRKDACLLFAISKLYFKETLLVLASVSVLYPPILTSTYSVTDGGLNERKLLNMIHKHIRVH